MTQRRDYPVFKAVHTGFRFFGFNLHAILLLVGIAIGGFLLVYALGQIAHEVFSLGFRLMVFLLVPLLCTVGFCYESDAHPGTNLYKELKRILPFINKQKVYLYARSESEIES
jgi:hypothetical protein